ncbi:unnamed protein product [Schistosoma curassoni]|uniref:Uncharacterized protein n=1 Tax=Schistosoma curassoni TaxID=6186 RepID=A0A183KZE6_9TREM|nr:unnamed protein product [Schistosoma curassoni]
MMQFHVDHLVLILEQQVFQMVELLKNHNINQL